MTAFKKPGLFDTPEGIEIIQQLKLMAADTNFVTKGSYAANDVTYPGNVMSFVEKHRDYLRAHPNTDPQQYLSNLRLMTRVK